MREVALEDVTVRFGDVEALCAMTTSVHTGEVVMLVGPNGAGKSTFIRVLLGLVRPDAGILKVDGAVRSVDNDFKSQLGYLPEAVSFSENLSGRQVLRFFAMARGVPSARVKDVLERVGLSHAARRRVAGYSRGMRQRLGLAVSILSEPELLILDEPTGGLDGEGLVVLYSILKEWRDEGRMVLMATHDIAMMEQRVDRMCVFRSGHLLADESPASLRRVANLPLRATLTLSQDVKDRAVVDTLEAELAAWDRCVARRSGRALTVEVPQRDLLGLMDIRGRHPEAVVDLRVEEPTLDVLYDKLLSEG